VERVWDAERDLSRVLFRDVERDLFLALPRDAERDLSSDLWRDLLGDLSRSFPWRGDREFARDWDFGRLALSVRFGDADWLGDGDRLAGRFRVLESLLGKGLLDLPSFLVLLSLAEMERLSRERLSRRDLEALRLSRDEVMRLRVGDLPRGGDGDRLRRGDRPRSDLQRGGFLFFAHCIKDFD
jgi:hypothetical protein